MPITKSAKKSLRVSLRRQKENQKQEIALEKALKSVNEKNVNQAISLIDKAAKTGIIHRNKAARLKSKLAKKFGTPKQLSAKGGSAAGGKTKSSNVKATAKSSKEKPKKTTKK